MHSYHPWLLARIAGFAGSLVELALKDLEEELRSLPRNMFYEEASTTQAKYEMIKLDHGDWRPIRGVRVIRRIVFNPILIMALAGLRR